jgi:sugar transferase (PEP-CTERM/EpsH1 system associated)
MTRPALLYICHRVPFPPDKGDKIRTFNQIRFLSKKWDIDLVTFADDPNDIGYVGDLEKICTHVSVFPVNSLRAKICGILNFAKGRSITEGFYTDAKAHKQVKTLLTENRYQAIFCFSSSMARYVSHHLGLIRTRSPVPRLVMDFCDMDSDKWQQYARKARFPLNRLFSAEARRLRIYEKKINQVFDVSVFVSEQEAALFRHQVPGAKHVVSVCNGVDFNYFSSKKDIPEHQGFPILIFTGAMDYYANIDGIVWFCRQILPKIRHRFPMIQFQIVGRNPCRDILALARIPGVRVTGYVKDIRPFYDTAHVCVIPLRIARGIQNKVLEAMAMGCPVVCTSAAFSGMDVKAETHAKVADTSEGFADAVVALLEDHAKASAMGHAAREWVKQRYDWSACLKKLDQVLS